MAFQDNVKWYCSPDVTNQGEDFLRQSLGQIQYVFNFDIPDINFKSLAVDEMENLSDYYASLFLNTPQRYITKRGADNQMIVYKESYDAEEKDLRGFVTNRPIIRSSDPSLSPHNTRTVSGADRANLYAIFKSFEINPARITYVNTGVIIPNLRMPCRIYSNPDFDKGDKYWQTVFTGGVWGDKVFPKLVDEGTVFYDHGLYLPTFPEPIKSNQYLEPKGQGAQSPQEIRSEVGMAIRSHYRDYNRYIENYQIWETNQHELCMPNIMIESNYWNDLIEFADDFEDLSKLSDKYTASDLDPGDELAPSGLTGVTQRQRDMASLILNARQDGKDPFAAYYNERVNEEMPYYHVINYFYPFQNLSEDGKNAKYLAPGLERSEINNSGLFQKKPSNEQEIIDNTYDRDQWYGETWINIPKNEDDKRNVINAQRNIFFTNDYFTKPNIDKYSKEVEKNYTQFGEKSQTANMKSIKITLKRHVDFSDAEAIDIDGKPTTDSKYKRSIGNSPRGRKQVRDLKDGSVFGETNWKGGWKNWHIRWAIEKHNFSGRFLELLKDLEDGNLSNFSMSEFPFLTHTKETLPIEYHPDQFDPDGVKSVQTYKFNKVENLKLEGFNWLDFLVYALNNPGDAINNDYLFLGPHKGENIATYGDSLLYRFTGAQNMLKVLDSSVDSLAQYFSEFTPKHIEKQITIDDPDTYTDIQGELYNMFLAPQMSLCEGLAYKIEKYGPQAEDTLRGNLQTWWIWNSSHGVSDDQSVEPEANPFTITDSQVKYGQEYRYVCYGYFAILSHKYKYSDFRLTKQTNAYTSGEAAAAAAEVGAPVVDRYCVEFYEPLSKIVAPQIFAISNSEEGNPRSYEYNNLSDYNSFAPSIYDVQKSPQVADFYLNIEPCIKIVKVPLFEKTLAVYDNPGNQISAVPFHVINDEHKIGFNVFQDNFKPRQYPKCLDWAEVQLRDSYLNSKDLYLTDEIKYFSQSPARYLEVYRLTKKPNSYFDFGGNLVSTIDLRIKDEHYNRTDFTFADKIKPNKKYYYMFRFVTENAMPGHVSTIYEAEIVDDGGYTYAKFDTVDTSEFSSTPFTQKTKPFKKVFQIEPNMRQMDLNFKEADFKQPARSQLDNVDVGYADQKIWGKTFKIRLTSKKSGKKTDLNLKFNLQEKDFS